jgi:hypothetical protein
MQDAIISKELAPPTWAYQVDGRTKVTVQAYTLKRAMTLLECAGYKAPDRRCVTPETLCLRHENGDTRLVTVLAFFERSIFVQWPLCGCYRVATTGKLAGRLLEAPGWRVVFWPSVRKALGYSS